MNARPSFRLVATLLTLVPSTVTGQVPTFKDVVGHSFGERITQHHQMVRYLERLAEASPRVTIEVQGRSWEGRKFVMAVVTSPDNHARIGQIQANSRRLSDPRSTSAAQAEIILANQPAVIWFGGSIHGFELSGSEGALKLLEHLSTRSDSATLEVLENVVVLIDPMLNPDGRDAFARLNHENIGRVPNAYGDDWANDFTPWQALKFRTGHYYFDNNRDWFAQTQPETRERTKTLGAWRPQMITDMHEMGPDREFFFYPTAGPISPHVPRFALEWMDRFAGVYAGALDSTRVDYATRDQYDYFYPGYTDAYPVLQGALGMLYEQGSSRGLALMRPSDRSTRTLVDALEHQYTAAWAATRFVATERETLLREYYSGLVDAIAAGSTGVRRYLLVPDGDPGHRAELVNVLIRGRLDVEMLTDAAVLDGVRDRNGAFIGRRTFPAGTYVVQAAQPGSPLLRSLLEPETAIPEDFVAEARARIDRGEPTEIYDITAWSLPLLFNVHGFSTTDGKALATRAVAEEVRPSTDGVFRRAEYAYLLDGSNAASVAALYHLTDRGLRVAMTLRPTRLEGEDVPSGTVVVRIGQNDASVHDAVREVANRFAVDVRAVSTGLAPRGFPSLGSADVIPVRKPEIAILAEDPIEAYSFGWAWFTLDREYGIPTTVIRTRSVAGTPLDRFDVLIVPATSADSLRATLGDDGVTRLRHWVRDGGTLVTLAGATDFAIDGLDLIALRSWYDTEDGEDARRFDVPGTFLRANLDREYWLSAGYGASEFPVLVDGSRIYLAPEGPPSSTRRVVARYASRDSLRISGLAWDESLDRMAGSVFVYEEHVGLGRVIAFAEDVNF
ncbi:MAG: hypothetical protein IIB35_05720, partial [Gemmatimonadetes bacterium]|nr:hypothetical protein [Gemmatimonadota bacterium]